jgi:hypothetical protein
VVSLYHYNTLLRSREEIKGVGKTTWQSMFYHAYNHAVSCEVPLNKDFVVAIVVMQAPKVYDHECIH